MHKAKGLRQWAMSHRWLPVSASFDHFNKTGWIFSCLMLWNVQEEQWPSYLGEKWKILAYHLKKMAYVCLEERLLFCFPTLLIILWPLVWVLTPRVGNHWSEKLKYFHPCYSEFLHWNWRTYCTQPKQIKTDPDCSVHILLVIQCVILSLQCSVHQKTA